MSGRIIKFIYFWEFNSEENELGIQRDQLQILLLPLNLFHLKSTQLYDGNNSV